MTRTTFKPVFLLALAVPLLVSWISYTLFYTSQERARVSSTGPADGNTPVLIGKAPQADPLKNEGEISYQVLLLYTALLAGVFAILGHYWKRAWLWSAALLLPLVFSLLYLSEFGLPLSLFYLANVLFALPLAWGVKTLFYHRAILRLRMILCSLLGAALFVLYLRLLYLLQKAPFRTELWSQNFFPALIIFIFITFGLSLADLLILRLSADKTAARPSTADDDEDDDA